MSILSMHITNSVSAIYARQCNHKILGLYYVWTGLLFGIYGVITSYVMRMELFSTGSRIICVENTHFYNLNFTLHGLIMIFFLVQSTLFGGFGNYFLPLLLNTSEIAFPKINLLSLMLLPFGYICLMMSIILEFGSYSGWTLYPPLSVNLTTTLSLNISIIIIGLVLSGVSSLLGSINFLSTAFFLISNGQKISMSSLYISSIIITSVLLILTLPILASALLMLISDIATNTIYFDPVFSGDPVFYQHLFWFFGHPEVYILILPAFGLISVAINSVLLKPIFGSQSMILAKIAIGVIGLLVWGHHLYTVGLEIDTRGFFAMLTILISIPTGTKLFNWISTIISARVTPINTCSLLLIMEFLFLFNGGGCTGVILSNNMIDIALHDTYYVVGHFHFVLSIGAIMAIIITLSQKDVEIFQMKMDYKLCICLSIGLFIAVLGTFVPMHFLGFNYMPRRISDYADSLIPWNSMSSLSTNFIVLIIVCLLF